MKDLLSFLNLFEHLDNLIMWLQQYNRVNRWLDRIRNISNPDNQVKPDDAMDYIIAFFQSCWHLKDWLMNDQNIKVDERLINNIKEFVEKKSKYIKISQNIANGSKHLDFKNYGRLMSGLSAKIVVDQDSQTWQSATYEFTQEGITYKVVDLAIQCFNEWELFLRDNKLL